MPDVTPLPDARRLRVRPLARGEVDVLQDVFDGLSVRSRYLRYHTAMTSLTPANRAALSAVDGRRRITLVAERIGPAGWVAEGLGHLVATGPDRAGVAVEVVDAAQGRGVGRTLLRHLVTVAEALDYRVVEADVLMANTPMLRLLGRLFPDARTTPATPAATTVAVEVRLG
ncbi:GNAT family N-acetyltransferase [Dactylosporangium sp. NPDC050588]|uniref:GNAT family N-acetyltransferase n=1 Tax=Dactylosporangium sp. NPDC050588 TaxID=3157211 RepID=UPI0033F28665